MNKKNEMKTRLLALGLSGVLLFSEALPTFAAEISDGTEYVNMETEEGNIPESEIEDSEKNTDDDEINIAEVGQDEIVEDFTDADVDNNEIETEIEEEQSSGGEFDDENDWAVKAELSSEVKEIQHQKGSSALHVTSVSYKLIYPDGSILTGKGKEQDSCIDGKYDELYEWALKSSDGEVYSIDDEDMPDGTYSLVMRYLCNDWFVIGECPNLYIKVTEEKQWAVKASLTSSINGFSIPQGFGNIDDKDFLTYKLENQYGEISTRTCNEGIYDIAFNPYELRLKNAAGEIFYTSTAPLGQYDIVLGYADTEFVELTTCEDCKVTVVDPAKLVDKKLNAGSNEITATRMSGDNIKLYTFTPDDTGEYYVKGDFYYCDYWSSVLDEDANLFHAGSKSITLQGGIRYYFWFYYRNKVITGNTKKYKISLNKKKEATKIEILDGQKTYRTLSDTPYLNDWKIRFTYADESVKEYRFDELWEYGNLPYEWLGIDLRIPSLDVAGLTDPYGNVVYGDNIYEKYDTPGTYKISLYKKTYYQEPDPDDEDLYIENEKKEILGTYEITIKESKDEDFINQKLYMGKNSVVVYPYNIFYKVQADTQKEYLIKIPSCEFIVAYKKGEKFGFLSGYGMYLNQDDEKKLQIVESSNEHYVIKIKPEDGQQVWLTLNNGEGNDSIEGDITIVPVDGCEHEYQLTETQEPTCDKSGKKIYTCSKCKESYEEVIPAKGHKQEVRNKKDATYTEKGYTGDIYCSECGEKLSEGTEIPMLTPDDETVIKANAFSNRADLVDINIEDIVVEIGDEAFSDCQNLTNIYFHGNCPKFGTDIFKNVKATAYYPYTDSTWSLDKLQGYGGEITWIPWNPETKEPAKRDLSICVSDIATSGYTYNGEAQAPKVTLTDGDYILEEGKDYQISCTDNQDAGTASFTITGDGTYGGTLEGTFLIDKAEPVLELEKEIIATSVGKFDKIDWKTLETDGELSRSVEDEDMAWVSNTDLDEGIYYSPEKTGTVKVTVTAEEGRNYLKGSTSFTLEIAKGINRIYAGNIVRNYSSRKQYITTDWTSDGNWEKVTFTSNSKYVKINSAGKITIAKGFVGQATITIKVKANENYNAGTKKVTVTVKPVATGIYKVTNSARRKATVTWKKNTTGTGYAIQYSRNKSFSSGVKTVYISRNRTTRAILSSLAKGKTYYVRVATYKTAGKKKILSSWSKAKSVKIRK